jgi:hypothetical protein
VCVCVRAYMRACMRTYVRVYVCACVCFLFEGVCQPDKQGIYKHDTLFLYNR